MLIINFNGEVWSNESGSWTRTDYPLASPTYIINFPYILTVDGRIYDTRVNDYVFEELGSIKTLEYDPNSVILIFLALNEDGELYEIVIPPDESPAYHRLVQLDVIGITFDYENSEMLIVHTNVGGGVNISINYTSINYDELLPIHESIQEEILEIRSGLILTTTHIYSYTGNFRVEECGKISHVQLNPNLPRGNVIISQFDNEIELTILVYSEDNANISTTILTESDSTVEFIKERLGVIGITKYGDLEHFVLGNGIVIRIDEFGNINELDIPTNVFKSTRMKNSRSRI